MITNAIIREKTKEEFGYELEELTEKSSKKVYANCPTCGTERLTIFRQISPTWTCPNCARKKGHKKLTKWSKDENFFSEPNSINSYWAGFIDADGSLNPKTKTISITLKRTDRNHLEKLKLISAFTGPIIDGSRELTLKTKESFYSDLRVYNSSKWIEDLGNNFKIFPNKTFSLLPPVNLSKEKQLCYLIGLIDGDGSIWEKENDCYLSVLGTEEIVKWTKSIIDSFTILDSSKANIHPIGKIFEYRVTKRRTLDFYNGIKELKIPKMERKWEKLERIINYANH